MSNTIRYFATAFLLTPIISCNVSDSQLEDRINDKLMAGNPFVRATVRDGVVRLTGTCPDESCKNVSETAAKELAGDNKVVSEIVVQEK